MNHVTRLRVRPLLILAAGLACAGSAQAGEPDGRRFLAFAAFDDWRRVPGSSSNEWSLTSAPLTPGIEWNELVLSWNAVTPPGTGLKFEAQPGGADPAAPFFVLGLWTAFPSPERPRESVPGQKQAGVRVQTDTLVLDRPVADVLVRVTFAAAPGTAAPKLRFLGASFLDRRVSPAALPPNRAAWGRELPVPERTQVIYPEGISSWCSPTSLSMLLAFWSGELDRPELNLEVPAVARAVHDPQWPGTGNWPFNTAFAGSFPGLRAFVTRLADVAELEDCVAAGIPVATSVSYNLLRGKPRTRDDGHLVVIRGFTESGDPIVNDPGTGKEIRRVCKRADLIRAWAVSHNTVYLVHPADRALPPSRSRHW